MSVTCFGQRTIQTECDSFIFNHGHAAPLAPCFWGWTEPHAPFPVLRPFCHLFCSFKLPTQMWLNTIFKTPQSMFRKVKPIN